MPFHSRAQARFMFSAESKGEVPSGTAKRWADHTPGGIKSLPKKVGDNEKKAFVASFLLKCAAANITDPLEIAEQAELYADSFQTKQAAGLGDILQGAAGHGLGAAMLGGAAGIALPTLGGYALGAATGSARNQIDTDDADSMRISAMANAYRRRAAEAKMNAQVQQLVASDPGKYVRIS